MKSISLMTPAEKLEERIRLEWELDGNLKHEFGSNFETYAAYRKAEEAGLIGFGPKTKKETLEDIPPLARHLSPEQVEQKIQARWDRSPGLQEEFGRNFSSFRAYCIAHSKGLCA
jgi:hypothetical protein